MTDGFEAEARELLPRREVKNHMDATRNAAFASAWVRVAKALREAHAKGQRSMRGRAAEACRAKRRELRDIDCDTEAVGADEAASDVDRLPIEGE